MAEPADPVRAPASDARRGDDRGSEPGRRPVRDAVVRRSSASPEAGGAHFSHTGRSSLFFGGGGPPGGGDRLPEGLRSGIEALSGIGMGDVRVHRDSSEPARFDALAFARGRDIHLGPGQERHLPHEAWHVVQQKQGRVGASAQMKGWALNEDEALEAEADRMGAAAARASATPASVQTGASASPPPVIQRKVRACGKWLDLSKPVSATLAKFIVAKERYVLRTDYCEKKLDPQPHLLDYTKKYLLGEAHNASLWNDEVKDWDVDTMVESESAIPPVEGDHLGRFKDKTFTTKLPGRAPVRREQPLESTHARLLGEAVMINDYINDLVTADMAAAWKTKNKKQLLHTRLRQAREHAWYTIRMMLNYSLFRMTYEKAFPASKKAPLPSSEMKRIYAFSLRIRDVYSKQLWALHSLLGGLEYASGSTESGAGKAASPEVPTVESGLGQLPSARAFLPVLAEDAMALTGVTDDLEADVLRAAMAHSGPTAENAVLAVTSRSRERGMIANVKSAKSPLLVKLGELHAERVAAGVGAAAVRVPYVQGVRMLEKLTRQPK